MSVPITGLDTITTYHFRARATNADGSATSADDDFTTTGAAGGGVAPGQSGDKARPSLTKLKLSKSRFAVGRGRSITLKFTLSEASAVKLDFAKVLTGKRVKSKSGKTSCRAVAHAPAKRSARCTIYRVAGSLSRKGVKGENSIKFTGKIGKKTLKPGLYRLTLFAIDDAANRSNALSAKFTIVRR